MADVTTSNQSHNTVIQDELVETFSRETPMLSVLETRLPENSGGPRWDANVGGASVYNFAEGGSLTTFSTDLTQPATLSWARYGHSFNITSEELSKAAYSAGPSYGQNKFAQKLKEGVRQIAKEVEQDVINGAGGNALIGFKTSIGTQLNEYAGIDGGTYSTWNPNVDVTGGTISKQIVTDFVADMATARKRPTHAFALPRVISRLSNLYDEDVRYTPGQGLGTPHRTLMIEGVQFIEVQDDGYSDAVSGEAGIFFFDRNVVRMEVLPYVEGAMFETQDIPFTGVSAGLALQKLASTASAHSFALKIQCQLVVEDRSRCGFLGGLDIS